MINSLVPDLIESFWNVKEYPRLTSKLSSKLENISLIMAINRLTEGLSDLKPDVNWLKDCQT